MHSQGEGENHVTKILNEKRPLQNGTFWQLRITNVQTQPFFIRGQGIFEPSEENDRQAL